MLLLLELLLLLLLYVFLRGHVASLRAPPIVAYDYMVTGDAYSRSGSSFSSISSSSICA